METFKKVIKKMYWLGLLGFAGTILDIPSLELFYLFFLLALVDFVLSIIIVFQTKNTNETVNDIKFLFQNLGMLIGIPLIYIRNVFHLPSAKGYKPKTLYSLPFENSWNVANGGIDKENSHSWSIVNQRYAYDFYIEVNGKTFSDSGKSVTDYYCYGKPILAPADGIVVEIKNLFDDTPIPDKPETLCSASDIRGNYIVIKHADHEYSIIAHIKKDSFCVNVGDSVQRGQQIARCGNSGNTSEPHIHFQIQQGKSFLLSASLPICFTDLINHTTCQSSQYIARGQIVENKK